MFFTLRLNQTNHDYLFQWNKQYNQKKYNLNSYFFNDTNNNIYHRKSLCLRV